MQQTVREIKMCSVYHRRNKQQQDNPNPETERTFGKGEYAEEAVGKQPVSCYFLSRKYRHRETECPKQVVTNLVTKQKTLALRKWST